MREKKHTACGFMQTLDNEFRGGRYCRWGAGLMRGMLVSEKQGSK
jgi:hypothetical protein